MMQAKGRDRGLPNYSSMGASPRDDAEFLAGVKLTNLEDEYGILARIWFCEPYCRVSNLPRRAHDLHWKGKMGLRGVLLH